MNIQPIRPATVTPVRTNACDTAPAAEKSTAKYRTDTVPAPELGRSEQLWLSRARAVLADAGLASAPPAERIGVLVADEIQRLLGASELRAFGGPMALSSRAANEFVCGQFAESPILSALASTTLTAIERT